MSESKVAASPKNHNLLLRVLTALVAVPLILLLLYRGPAWGFFLLTTAAALVGVYELFGMTHPGDRFSQALGAAGTLATCAGVFFAGPDATLQVRVFCTILIVVPISGPLLTLVRLGEIPTAALRAFSLSVGPLFIGLPLTWLAVMRRDFGAGTIGPGYVVMTLMFAWFSDTGGYFAGRFLGRHKLYEAVSPKKTIEGALGGLVGAALGGCLASFWFLPELSPTRSIPLAVVAGAVGQAGDLAESLIKRSVGVKDSGVIVPGHGGILDRVDALLMTSSVVYLAHLWLG